VTTGTTSGRSAGRTPGDIGEAGPGTGGIVRSSTAMALGTVISRATGFLRTVVLATAIGLAVGDAYNVANTLPNVVYELLLGGVLTSVVVPLVVEAATRDGDDGEAYAQRLLTLVAIALTAATTVAVLLAPWIIRLYTGGRDPATVDLATTFARFFLPQIIFYGLGALIGAILNTRDSFAPPMWTPILNNIVVIATGLLFIAVTTGAPQPGHLSTTQTWVLGFGTTLGIVVQTVALLPALRRTGFRLRVRWDFRNSGLRRAARLAGWVLVYVAANQLAFIAIVRLARGAYQGGFSAYTYAFFLVQLPHAIVAVSVITALLPRMSRAATAGRRDLVADDLATGLKLAGVLLVPAQLVCIVLGPLIATVVFAHLNIDVDQARFIGAVLAAYAVSLVPFSAFQLQLRGFYALQDTRTPALVNVAIAVLNVVVDVILFVTLHGRDRVVGLAIGYSVSYIAGFILFTALLRRRLQRPERRTRLLQTYVRLSVAAVLGTAVAWVVATAAVHVLDDGPLGAGVGVFGGLLLGTPVYVAAAMRMRVAEMRQVAGMVRRRFG
jgi:putative peptidoglycan lipid II flippase